MGGLRMIDADGMNQKEEEEAPVTTLSEDDLDARIAALGLGGENGVEDKSTGERSSLLLSPSRSHLAPSLFLNAQAYFLPSHFVLPSVPNTNPVKTLPAARSTCHYHDHCTF